MGCMAQQPNKQNKTKQTNSSQPNSAGSLESDPKFKAAVVVTDRNQSMGHCNNNNNTNIYNHVN